MFPDPEDLCGQRSGDRAAEAVDGRALPGHERVPQQAGRGGRERHLPGLRHPHQGAALSGEDLPHWAFGKGRRRAHRTSQKCRCVEMRVTHLSDLSHLVEFSCDLFIKSTLSEMVE